MLAILAVLTLASIVALTTLHDIVPDYLSFAFIGELSALFGITVPSVVGGAK